jgi:pimeloyl-ACP methyl ester carboxylesterase
LSLPKGRVPKGGWPVITYGHGTTGIADACAPSRDRAAGQAHGLIDYAHPLLRRWLKAGYAVVRTDYEGLGTPGAHPYLIGRSEGYAMLDVVRAARRLDQRLGRRVIIAGHSQGGHAALWAASLAGRWTPELKVRGTVALAPVSHLGEQAALLRSLTSPDGLSGLVAMILRGIDVARPGLGVPLGLSERAAALYPRTLTDCVGRLASPSAFGALAPAELIRPEVEISGVVAALNREDPERLTIRTPVRIHQGTADSTVFKAFTDPLVEEYRGRGVRVTYKTYEGVDHGGVVTSARSARDATTYIRSRLRG